MGVLRVRDGGTWVDLDFGSGTSGSWVPIGVILMFGGPTAPPGFMLCNGNQVSRTLYSQLFAAIGTSWGVGDGTTTFNLPDMRGRAGVGAGQGTGLTNRVIGTYFGAESVLLQASESGMPAHTPTGSIGNDNAEHTHTYSANTGTVSADHTHVNAGGYNVVINVGSPSTWNLGNEISNGTAYVGYLSYGYVSGGGISTNHTHAVSGTTSGRSAVHQHGVTINQVPAANAASAHANSQPSAVVNHIIRVT
jgi:microcystin-dependent protein